MSDCTHHFIINSENVGHCKHCLEVRDFGRLLERAGVFVVAGRRGAKASKGVARKTNGRRRKEPATRAKRSAAATERWQNPEYRANQRAAHAALSGRRHKKEELL